MKRLTEEQEAFLNRLPDVYGAPLTKYAYRFFGYKPHMLPVVEDAMQETFIKAVRSVDVLMKHPNPHGWMIASLKYILLDKSRELNRRREDLYGEETEIPAFAGLAAAVAPEIWQSGITLPQVVEQAADVLSKEEMQTFADHYLLGLTMGETAAQEGVSQATVRGRLNRIRKKLRKTFCRQEVL